MKILTENQNFITLGIMSIQTKTNGIFGEKIRIEQPENGYRAGIDPLFLASLGENKGHCLDLGCGVGTVLLALKHRCPDITGIGIEIQPHLAALATRNIAENGFKDLSILNDNFKNLKNMVEATSFDQVFMNPPYFEEGTYFKDQTTQKAIANHEGETGYVFMDWLNFANYALKPKGLLYIIHRSERLDDLLHDLKKKSFGDINLYPLWPRNKSPSKLVLIRAQKGSRAPVTLNGGMILHDESGNYTPQAHAILMHGASFGEALKMQ